MIALVRVDTDSDSDGVADTIDSFPSDANGVDTDFDGVGNNADPDDDNDGTADDFDAFPLDSTEFLMLTPAVLEIMLIQMMTMMEPQHSGYLSIDDYQTALLDSGLATSPFGIVGFSASALKIHQLYLVSHRVILV